MLERIGRESLSEIKAYLAEHYAQNILLLDDLHQAPEDPDRLTLLGYRHQGRVIAAQGFYQYGRWLPHYRDELAVEALLADMRHRHVRWLMGFGLASVSGPSQPGIIQGGGAPVCVGSTITVVGNLVPSSRVFVSNPGRGASSHVWRTMMLANPRQ